MFEPLPKPQGAIYPVDDLGPLASLVMLEELDLDDTEVSDITPLQGLTNLNKLILSTTFSLPFSKAIS